MLTILVPSHDVINIAVPSLKREQGMSMVEELTVIVSHNITVERYQFQHPLKLISLKTASLRDEHL